MRIRTTELCLIFLLCGCSSGHAPSLTPTSIEIESPTRTYTLVPTETTAPSPTLTPTPYIWPWKQGEPFYLTKDGDFFGWDTTQNKWDKYVIPVTYEARTVGQVIEVRSKGLEVVRFRPENLEHKEISVLGGGKVSVLVDAQGGEMLFVRETGSKGAEWIMTPLEYFKNLPAWAKPELDRDPEGDLFFRDVNQNVLTKYDTAEGNWKGEVPLFYNCGIGRQGGWPSKMDEKELESQFPDGRVIIRSLTGCVTKIERVELPLLKQGGLSLEMEYWVSFEKSYEFKVLLGWGQSIGMRFGNNYRTQPLDDSVDPTTNKDVKGAYSQLQEWFMNPLGSKQVNIYIPIEYIGNITGLDPVLKELINMNSSITRKVFDILSGANPEDFSGATLYAFGIQ